MPEPSLSGILTSWTNLSNQAPNPTPVGYRGPVGRLDQGSPTELRWIPGARGLEGDHIYRVLLSGDHR